ncbi:MAG: LysM peptidoglycan-binding domain-containing protein [Candidatus Pacebacteria bacterium]|nr:LysM peptidoglycan-binding domain-containing protein [Candidatus Paceibacterota bacterium]
MKNTTLKSLLKSMKTYETVMSFLFGFIAICSSIWLLFTYAQPYLGSFGFRGDVFDGAKTWWKEVRVKPTPSPVLQLSGSAYQNGRVHRTTATDTLWKLAQQYYNDGYQWTRIYEANKAIIANPNVLEKDLDLVIPE